MTGKKFLDILLNEYASPQDQKRTLYAFARSARLYWQMLDSFPE